MLPVHKLEERIFMKFDSKDKEGFALVAAMMAILILTAAGLLAFAISTQDVRTSGRLVGEKKALSAAETGATWLCQSFNPSNLTASAVTNVTVDLTNDPASQFTIGTPTRPTSGASLLPMIGYSQSGGQQWGQARFNAPITGSNTRYMSNAQANLGIGYGPVEMTTTYR
jgi:hypothetical protein